MGVFSLAGCMVGPDFTAPASGLDALQLAPRAEQVSAIPTSDSPVPAHWWALFNDPTLIQLQSRAQSGNLDIQMASERIEQSRAQLGIVASQLLPTVGAEASYTREALPLPSLPTRVPLGVPSELARRRPDILRAEAQLHAATAAIGVAKADFYPRIGLKGRVGMEAFNSGDLSSWDSRFFSIGPTVYLPIFQGGRLTQRLALNESRQKTAALVYRQTVLSAWHEVDNALDAWAARQREHEELQASYEQNQLALRAAERGYQQGAADYLSVLTAQRNLLASQTLLNNSATDATLTVVNLYKSLGGGWDPEIRR
ncbi:TolC family protein [Pseudomonas sp. 20TX0172]|nr:TolC family protein [Pseudomonas uvaldensis]MCE0464132.1 TolC family protein [Pseudomonas uvaldensis]